jgi:preprotein translocase subunit YajC
MYWLLVLSLLPIPAHANAGAGGFDVMSLLPIVLIFVVFYFLLLRPQQKKAKQHQELLGNLRRGDKVITAGGLIGTVSKVTADNEVILDVGDNVNVHVVKSMITDVMTKSEPVASSSKSNVAELPRAANKPDAKTPAKAKTTTSKKTK